MNYYSFKIRSFKFLFIFVFIFAAAFSAVTSDCSAGVLNERCNNILYVPMDDRPVNLLYVKQTADAAGFNLICTPYEYLPKITVPGDTDKIWNWLLENVKYADSIILSGDTMIYGGLVPSRIHMQPVECLEKNAEKFNEIKKINPNVKVYVFNTIMRTPKSSRGGVEPAYYEKFGPKIFQITALNDKAMQQKLSETEQVELSNLNKEVPENCLEDWFARREKNLAINKKMIDIARSGKIDYFILCRDDCYPYSQSRLEYRILAKYAEGISRERFISFMGADELGMVLLARCAGEMRDKKTSVFVKYSDGPGPETVPAYEDYAIKHNIAAHIAAAYAETCENESKADMVLYVNTPFNGVTKGAEDISNKMNASSSLEVFVSSVKKSVLKGRRVSIADVAFANGSDNALMIMLHENSLLAKISAYAGWNTAGNTIGYAVGQGILSSWMRPHEKNRMLALRYLDEWAYQANFRKQIYELYLKPRNLPREHIGLIEFQAKIKLRELFIGFADKYLGEFLINNIIPEFPWNRLFEVQLGVR
ncbi:MAG: DUF4127 family protein [Candidatus Wallbacteria bacterium]